MIVLARNVWRRAREERLVQMAGSLTFATVLAAVPLLAAGFALFTRFPALAAVKQAIDEHLLRSLLPGGISRTVLNHLRRFAANANGLTLVGFLFLCGTAVLMLLNVENALNRIWAAKKDRPLARRVALYLLVLGIGPLLLGAGLWSMAFLLRALAGLLHEPPPWAVEAMTLGPVLLGAVACAIVFRLLPNTDVRRRDALAGGLIASIGFELGKRGFAAWLLKMPTYKAVYGAFATLPIFLLWVYFSWLVMLGAALVAANLGGAGKAARRPARPPRKR